MRALFVSSEIYPFAKSGGLADVAFSLPRALNATLDVEVIMPLYRFVDRERYGIRPTGFKGEARLGSDAYAFELFECEYEGLTCCFVYSEPLCERDYMYGEPEAGYPDNALRFGIFCRAVLAWADHASSYRILHLNDWQSALCALWVKEHARNLRCVYTIHNLAYQGDFDRGALKTLGLKASLFRMELLEFYGRVNLMKAGIACADALTTVSRRYAREILGPKFGYGLEGFLQYHQSKLHGIPNGIDTQTFDPASDPALWDPYDAECPEGKALNKAKLCALLGLENPERPLWVFIGRLTWQKGVDLLLEALPDLLSREVNVAMIGEGERRYREAFKALDARHANLCVRYGYDEPFSHRLYGAADFLLMPSLFEPCGLNQLIAMRYGAVPVVHAVGGLVDTVAPVEAFDPASERGFGVRFDAADADAFSAASDAALALFDDAGRLDRIRRHNMRVDVSWHRPAAQYAALYAALLAETSTSCKEDPCRN